MTTHLLVGEEQILWFEVTVGDRSLVQEGQGLQKDTDQLSRLRRTCVFG